MKKIFTKNIELQDAKYKLVSNNNNETSIFIPKENGEAIGLENDKEFTINLNKENILYTLFYTFNFSVDKKIFEKREPVKIDYKKVIDTIDILKNLPDKFSYKVNVSINGNRYYLKNLRQENGLNIRDLLIGGIYKIDFFETDEKKIMCYINRKEDDIKIDAEKKFDNKIEGFNIIYYGAPGTGKSYKVDQIIEGLNPKFYRRVTFHPEYDNTSFVGGYKPSSEKNDNEDDVVSYKFVPQAFVSIYTDAWIDLDHKYYLVIEEINRGNCAEIFGEIFQLLDRNSNYTVTPSKELKEHIIASFKSNAEHEGIAKGLKLPPNLHILATMNTSDQSLFPMDSAFKRRWEWEYMPICYTAQTDEGKDNQSFNFEIDLGDGSKYRWIDFIAKINNNHIKNNQALGMDKCIGNYFVKPNEANNITIKPFINKVVFYLWNDVFKDEDNKVFESKGSYEDFFPILTNGLTKVKELFARIQLSAIPTHPDTQEEVDSVQVAEDNQPVTE